ncbi:hypothetical protein L9F63_000120, partial [Diploptera punctata]
LASFSLSSSLTSSAVMLEVDTSFCRDVTLVALFVVGFTLFETVFMFTFELFWDGFSLFETVFMLTFELFWDGFSLFGNCSVSQSSEAAMFTLALVLLLTLL